MAKKMPVPEAVMDEKVTRIPPREQAEMRHVADKFLKTSCAVKIPTRGLCPLANYDKELEMDETGKYSAPPIDVEKGMCFVPSLFLISARAVWPAMTN